MDRWWRVYIYIKFGRIWDPEEPPDCNGQCRSSIGELPSGVGSAGPHPGRAQAKWAADLIGQKKNVRRYARKGFQKIYQKRISENISDENIRRYVRKHVRKECQKIYQKECRRICQKRISEDMSEKDWKGCQKYMKYVMSIELLENMSKKNVRR